MDVERCGRRPVEAAFEGATDEVVESGDDGAGQVLVDGALGGQLDAQFLRDHYRVADRADDPDARFDLDALALACHARRRGWNVRVESPYLPPRLLQAAEPFQDKWSVSPSGAAPARSASAW
ncbi:Imm49 family immunity protein [Streptomyces sp. 303MFCol5.2]|uniref:Imm49 family immunity protein n=1 Tax=Streptomyces sp. 303MFCol5.2 TaxID=1172181 RepID=UPI0003A34E9A|nr:Imm49 family immunity protein [Streptomyces sp. 303MFCol5.2]